MLTRRSFVKTLTGCVCCSSWNASAATNDDDDDDDDDDAQDAVPDGGCFLNAEETSSLSKKDDYYDALSAAFSTGDANIDRQLGQALVRATQFFGIRPAFGFYNEQNAQASPSISSQYKGTWGTVLFGTPLFKDEFYQRDRSGMTVIAIVAHEFGHIVQFKRDLRNRVLANQPTVKRLELHADILAGYYIGSLKRISASLPVYSAGEVFHRIGDNKFNSPNHHGTPKERKDASELGFNNGIKGGVSLDSIINIGLEYVSHA